MNRILLLAVPMLAVALAMGQGKEPWQRDFHVNKSTLKATGRNSYMVLEPGYKLELRGGGTHLIITVLDKTETVDGVKTRVVEERETKDGKLIEISRNFFAFDPKTRDIYYFGEDVDMYRDGKVTSHDGAWRSGVDGAHFGLMVPGKPRVGMAYYQEVAPKVAMDRAKVVSITETVSAKAGTFKGCLKTEETTPLEPGAKEYKQYAPGVGLIADGDVRLVKKP